MAATITRDNDTLVLALGTLGRATEILSFCAVSLKVAKASKMSIAFSNVFTKKPSPMYTNLKARNFPLVSSTLWVLSSFEHKY
jgi:hypothetical protein